MDLNSPYVQVGIKLLLSVLAGGIIGFEREWRRKPAGLRTNILICLSAALLMITSRHISGGAAFSDPARLVAQVVVGVGFIGAGVIMRARGSVTGLTTAATILAVTAIGVAIGDGMFAVSIAVTVLIVLVLSILGYLERFITRRRRLFHFTFHTDQPADVHARLLDVLERERLRLSEFDVGQVAAGGNEVSLSVVTSSEGSQRLMEKLSQLGTDVKVSTFDTE